MNEYISADLLTPKKRLVDNTPELQREYLLDSQQLKLISATYEQSPRAFEDATEAATNVAQLVRQTIDFVSTSAFTPPLSAEIVAERETANCFGHTIIASECLEKISIEHFVSYANQHAFLTMFDRASNKAFLLDIATKELCCDMKGAIGGEDPLDQLARGVLRAENTLYSNELLKRLPPSINREKFIDMRPWLSFDADDLTQFREERPADRVLQMFTLPSVPGRMLLLQQYNAGRQLVSEDFDEAVKGFSELSGIYLDVDSRNGLKEMDDMRKSLLRAERYGEAIELATMVDDSLVASDRSRNRFFLGDTLRMVAKKTRNKELAQQALKSYLEIPDSSLKNGKVLAARKLLSSL